MLNSAVNLRRENIWMKAVLGLMGLAAVLCVSPLAGAADLTGTWKGSFDFNGNSVPTALNLKVAGADVTGSIEGLPTSPVEIHEGKLAADHIDFSFGTDDGSWGSTLIVKKDVVAAAAAPAIPEPPKAIDVT